MKCEQVQDILSEYLDGEITEAWRTEEVEQHLKACDSCRALLSELRDVQKAVHSLLTVTAPKEMINQVAKGVEGIAAASGVPVQEIRRAETQLTRSPWRRFVWPVMMAAAASVLAIFVVIQVGTMLKEENHGLVESEGVKVAQGKAAEKLAVENVPETSATAPPPAMEKQVAGHGEGESRALAAAAKGAETEKAKSEVAFMNRGPEAAATAPPALTTKPQAVEGVADQKRDASEPPRLEERIPPLVARQLAQFGKVPGAGAAAAPAAPAPAEAAARQGKAADEVTEEGKTPPESRADKAKKDENREVAIETTKERVSKEEEQKETVSAHVGAARAPSLPAEVPPPLTGRAESRTLTLRAQDIPAATAEVKQILARHGAQLSRDYYAGGGLEGAGARIIARMPATRYQSLLTELREKNYPVVPERAKSLARAKKSKSEANAAGPPDVLDLTIRFQAY